MAIMQDARRGILSKEMKEAAKKENVSGNFIRKGIAKGTIVVPANILHKSLKPIGIGKGLTVKVNSNIGTSPYKTSLKEELKKLEISVKYGADTIMDLSTGGDIDSIRKAIVKKSPIPVGTVPIYHAVVKKEIGDLTSDDILNSVEQHAKDGVDFVTVHCGVTRKTAKLAKKRVTGIVSRGGAFLSKWMNLHSRENPLFSEYDSLLEIAKKYDITLSLGDGLRPGSIIDATDKSQIEELKILGSLVKRAWKENVQVIVEGPGHVPLNQIQKNIEMQKKYCHNAPFYVLGPLVTDIAPGYDHITSAIGGALAAYYGADYLCYVTPAEHLRLPSLEDVREGVIAAKIAGHAADIAKGLNVKNRDLEISKARKNLDWEKQFKLAIDPEKARKYRKESNVDDSICTMCGKYCSMKK